MSKTISIAILCIALVKLEEFQQGYSPERSFDFLKCLIASTYLNHDVDDKRFFDEVFELRSMKPFIDLNLQQERFVYETFYNSLDEPFYYSNLKKA